jgi:hypothetical protein
VLLIVGVLLTAINLWICSDREAQKAKVAEREGFLRYMRGTNHELQAQTKSVLSGLAGLVDETAPTAKGAVDILDHEIAPNLEYIAESGRTILPEGEAARLLHSEYLRALATTRVDAVKLRAIFADASLDLREQRQRARAVLVESAKLYQAFDRHVLEAAARVNTVIVAPPPMPGPNEGGDADAGIVVLPDGAPAAPRVPDAAPAPAPPRVPR